MNILYSQCNQYLKKILVTHQRFKQQALVTKFMEI